MSFREELERKSVEWVQGGVISAGQRERILAGEPPAPGAAPRLVGIFSLLGATLVVLGVILVVSQNWSEIPRMTKLAAGIALMTGAYAGGYWLRFGPLSMTRTGEGVLLIGTGTLLANLALISQQYNIDFNPSPLLLPVLLAAVASAYLLRSRAFIFAAAAVAIFWLIFEIQRDGSEFQTQDAAALLVIAGGGVWLMVAAEANRRFGWDEFAAPLRFAGGFTIFSAVYALGFYRHYEVDERIAAFPAIALLVVPLVLAVAALVAVALKRESALGWPRVPAEVWPPVVAAIVVLVALVAWSFAVGANPRPNAERTFIIYTTGFWVIALALAADLAWLGLALRREWWINAALVYVGLFAITRYFDLFNDFAQTGAVFAGAGLFLLVLAFALERGRRALRHEMTGSAG
ncbi:MAG: DUF2157 domain-containing protein [Chloroflexi bacterium]|nr:DUF2157 domain-containing protein [Chloroflexota bacterium]MDA1146976.1 DUF2157 domain-containing protein [Chloroflexota bacterium]